MVDVDMEVVMAPPRERTGVTGIAVRTALLACVFILLLVVACLTLDHAIRHAAFTTTYSNGDYFKSSIPTISDAIRVFALGPLLQVVVFVALYAAVSRRSLDGEKV